MAMALLPFFFMHPLLKAKGKKYATLDFYDLSQDYASFVC